MSAEEGGHGNSPTDEPKVSGFDDSPIKNDEPVSPERVKLSEEKPSEGKQESNQTSTSMFESTEDSKPVSIPVEDSNESPNKEQNSGAVDGFTSRAKELTELLLNLATEKKCPDHNQAVVTICTNFTCSRRFWCGICCVKYKDLYVRHNSDMTLIEDFLSEHLGKLYKVKTCMEEDKDELHTVLDKLQGQLEDHYHNLWNQAEVDIEKLKQEILTRVENNRIYLKERHEKWLSTVHEFFAQIKGRVSDSPVRDCGAELDLLKKNVEQSHEEVLTVIETIGNKVTKDISQIEELNKQFSKIREFIAFLESQFDTVRDQTSPSHVPLEREVATLGTRFDQIASIKIRGLLEDPRKDLKYLLDFHGSLYGTDNGKGSGALGMFAKKTSKTGAHNTPNMYREGTEEYRLHAMIDLLHATEGREYPIREADDRYGAQQIAKNSRLFQDRRVPNISKDDKKPTVSQSTTVQLDYSRDNGKSVMSGSQKSTTATRPSAFPGYPLPQSNPLTNLPSNISIPDEVGDHDRVSPQPALSPFSGVPATLPTVFDGSLLPSYSDVELEHIDKLPGFIAVNEIGEQLSPPGGKDVPKSLANYVPVMYTHHNNMTFASRCFVDPEGGVIHTFNVYMCVEETSRGDSTPNANLVFLESGEEVFWSATRITHFTVIERDSDQTSVLCVATEDTLIRALPFTVNLNSSKVLEFLDGITTCQLSTDSITNLKRFGRSDLLVCTTSGGDVVVVDTIRGEIQYNEKQCDGSISSASFVQDNTFFLIGSGCHESIKHDNSLTFLSVNSSKGREVSNVSAGPTFKYKVRVKKAHGDTFGVICVAADNSSKAAPIVFSAGGKDDPCIKVWNFESKELIKTIDTKDGVHHLALCLIAARPSSESGLSGSVLTKQETKNAWKTRADEMSNFQKLRDENKKRKIGGRTTEPVPTGALSFVLVDVMNKGIRAYKVTVVPGTKQSPTARDIGLAFDVKARLPGFATGLSQLAKLAEDNFVIQLATHSHKLELYGLKLSLN